jgi:hypothetical protein
LGSSAAEEMQGSVKGAISRRVNQVAPPDRCPGACTGGWYSKVKGRVGEGHHMPCFNATKKKAGPAIKLSRGWHKKTGSWGMRRSAREYRKVQRA